jgi:nucleoside-diphosphate-sugar epimerase
MNSVSQSHSQYRFAVLGAGGFIGGALTERLLELTQTVRPIVHRIGAGSALLARFGVEQRVCDILKPNLLAEALEGCDILFHCACGDRSVIVDGLANTLRVAKAVGIRRIVYLSTTVIHGYQHKSELNENSRVAPPRWLPYARHKAAAESVVARFRKAGGVDCVVVRPSIVYGPGSIPWSYVPAVEIRRGRSCLIEGGRGCCNCIFIENLIDAMLLCAEHPTATNETYLVDDEWGLTWHDYYCAIGQVLNTTSFFTTMSYEQWRGAKSASKRILRWARDTPAVLRHALHDKTIKDWLKRAPGFATARKVFPPEMVRGNGRRSDDPDPLTPLPSREIAELHRYPVVISALKIRTQLGWVPRLKFLETMERIQRWYSFLELT